MKKIVIEKERFIEKCNQELKKDPYYQSGMVFAVGTSAGLQLDYNSGYINGPNGIDYLGPEEKIGVFTRARYKVKSFYQIGV